jgi:hypothetical protein
MDGIDSSFVISPLATKHARSSSDLIRHDLTDPSRFFLALEVSNDVDVLLMEMFV